MTIPMVGRHYAMLKLFMTNQGQVLTQQRIIDEVWGRNGATRANLQSHIVDLRRKIHVRGAPRLIHTERGVGYKFQVPD